MRPACDVKGKGIETEVNHTSRHAIREKGPVSISVRVTPSGELKGWTHAPVFGFRVWATE